MYTQALQIQKVVESRREVLVAAAIDAGMNECKVAAEVPLLIDLPSRAISSLPQRLMRRDGTRRCLAIAPCCTKTALDCAVHGLVANPSA